MPSCTPPCLFFRPCQNFSDHVPFPRRNFSPTMSEFFPIPNLYAVKNPLLVDGRDPGLSQAKNAVGGSVNIP